LFDKFSRLAKLNRIHFGMVSGYERFTENNLGNSSGQWRAP
jgi:hypothetical protein